MTFLLDNDVDVVDDDIDNVGLFFLGVSDSDDFLVFSTTTTVQRIARWNVWALSIKLVEELASLSLSTSASGASGITDDWRNSGREESYEVRLG